MPIVGTEDWSLVVTEVVEAVASAAYRDAAKTKKVKVMKARMREVSVYLATQKADERTKIQIISQ